MNPTTKKRKKNPVEDLTQSAFYTYGFHEEFLRRRSKVSNKIIKNLSSTSPSSNIALHSGPRRESCNTLIGVIAKCSGTTNKTPEFLSKSIKKQSLFLLLCIAKEKN